MSKFDGKSLLAAMPEPTKSQFMEALIEIPNTTNESVYEALVIAAVSTFGITENGDTDLEWDLMTDRTLEILDENG